jgi:hypothetical protein
MELTVLAVPDCPNAAVLERRLAAVLAGRPPIAVTRQVITSPAEAARWGMHGSPTLLVNGEDPFAEPGTGPVVASCRLYLDDDGLREGAPTVAALRRVLEQSAAVDEASPPSLTTDPERDGDGDDQGAWAVPI